MLWAISCPCLSLGRPRIHDASKISSFHLVATEINEKVGWMGKCLKSGSFAFEGRIVAFVIDSCPAHPHIFNLKSIKLYFLPPNTTSKTQPMDQGVICKIPQECCPENYSKCREEEKPFENFVAASNANVSLSLGCAIDANGRELLSKVWNIHRNPANGIA